MKKPHLSDIVFIDLEVDKNDYGAVNTDGSEFHSKSLDDFHMFIKESKYVCGHNIIDYDSKYIKDELSGKFLIDTLHISPILFPGKPYHKLVKDYKLVSTVLNNPCEDAKLVKKLFVDEFEAFSNLDEHFKVLFGFLLSDKEKFTNFFRFINYKIPHDINTLKIVNIIQELFGSKICTNAPIQYIVDNHPIELAYALAQISVIDTDSITPPWVLRNYEYRYTVKILRQLRSTKCEERCMYCNEALDETKALTRYFGFSQFRKYNDENLQEQTVKAILKGESLIAVFPTGGGKSITFQLPALMTGDSEKGLTVVISPLRSLMKDQTEKLVNRNIVNAVAINSSLNPADRKKAFDIVTNGKASILYISPESLRSKSIENLMLNRNIVRFVIDEAHCLSAWGQDFRADYLYIGKFIKELQEKKKLPQGIPVSCFTATAKPKVVEEIIAYFKKELSLNFVEFRAKTERKNLEYFIHPINTDDKDDISEIRKDIDEEKKTKLLELLKKNKCPTIIYVATVDKTKELAEYLSFKGFKSVYYHGNRKKMDDKTREAHQDAFMKKDKNGNVKANIIVATTAFGMGVDKDDVGMVIHYDISSSLEDYIQEAGRAGRDECIQAECHILYNEEDLSKHFNLLKQNKITKEDIQQVWRPLYKIAISGKLEKIPETREPFISLSYRDVARKAGWDTTIEFIEDRAQRVISALDQAEFIERGKNKPKIYASSISVKDLKVAKKMIEISKRFDDNTREDAKLIIERLFLANNRTGELDTDNESRIDYISDRTGIEAKDIIKIVELLREEKILDNENNDISVQIEKTIEDAKSIIKRFYDIHDFLLNELSYEKRNYVIRDLCMKFSRNRENQDALMKNLATVLNYYDTMGYIYRNKVDSKKVELSLNKLKSESGIRDIIEKQNIISNAIITCLYKKTAENLSVFTPLELKETIEQNLDVRDISVIDIYDTLYYLNGIKAFQIMSSFFVTHNKIDIIFKNTKPEYTDKNYERLDEYYINRREQIHIVGEYARLLVEDKDRAKVFCEDYFSIDYSKFISKYFNGREEEIKSYITPKRCKLLFDDKLDYDQQKIIDDDKSEFVTVLAGPGSGKTRLLTHKLASLHIREDIKDEQMLMLTFSRTAASEFMKQMKKLIGSYANNIQIATFHSYCYSILGVGPKQIEMDSIVSYTVNKIENGDVDRALITKTVLVIDEAQDMREDEYLLVIKLKENNSDMRIIAVGDDDQNIFEFRGSSSEYFYRFYDEQKGRCKKYELLNNYRSVYKIVDFSNRFVEGIENRKKEHKIKSTFKRDDKRDDKAVLINRFNNQFTVLPTVNALKNEISTIQTNTINQNETTCIATWFNDDVYEIATLLQDYGYKVRNINEDSPKLYNLSVVRDFINRLNNSDVNWDEAKKEIYEQNTNNTIDSNDLKILIGMIEQFESVNVNSKDIAEFEIFTIESNIEDFMQINDDEDKNKNEIIVSTLHKIKSKEFDNVYIALPDKEYIRSRLDKPEKKISDNEMKRLIYVGVTRAMKKLRIFTNDDYFDRIQDDYQVEGTYKVNDNNISTELPDKITLDLSYSDVVPDYYYDTNNKPLLDELTSGKELSPEIGRDNKNWYSCYKGKKILWYSRDKGKKKGMGKINCYEDRKYLISRVVIRHIIYYRSDNKLREDLKNKEIKLILPSIEFKKNTVK